MKTFETLISVDELSDHLDHPDWVIVDCRFSLDDPEWGWNAYRQGHIPRAVYASLETDLSGPAIPGRPGATLCRKPRRLW